MNPSFGPKKSAGRLSQGGHDGQNECPHALEWLGRRADGIVPDATTSTSSQDKKSCDAGGAADGWFASGPFRPTTTCSCSPPQGPPPARSLHGADVSRECSNPSGPPRMLRKNGDIHNFCNSHSIKFLLNPRCNVFLGHPGRRSISYFASSCLWKSPLIHRTSTIASPLK